MKIVRDIERKEIKLVHNDDILFSMSFFFDEFVWCFYTDSDILITRELDSDFYDNLNSLMNGKYIFNNNVRIVNSFMNNDFIFHFLFPLFFL